MSFIVNCFSLFLIENKGAPELEGGFAETLAHLRLRHAELQRDRQIDFPCSQIPAAPIHSSVGIQSLQGESVDPAIRGLATLKPERPSAILAGSVIAEPGKRIAGIAATTEAPAKPRLHISHLGFVKDDEYLRDADSRYHFARGGRLRRQGGNLNGRRLPLDVGMGRRFSGGSSVLRIRDSEEDRYAEYALHRSSS